jgi:hypothetical protein
MNLCVSLMTQEGNNNITEGAMPHSIVLFCDTIHSKPEALSSTGWRRCVLSEAEEKEKQGCRRLSAFHSPPVNRHIPSGTNCRESEVIRCLYRESEVIRFLYSRFQDVKSFNHLKEKCNLKGDRPTDVLYNVTLTGVRCCRGKELSRVCVVFLSWLSGMQWACAILSSVDFLALLYFFQIVSQMARFSELKCVFVFSVQLFCTPFIILRRILRGIVATVPIVT